HGIAQADRAADAMGGHVEPVVGERALERLPDPVGVTRIGERARQQALEVGRQAVERLAGLAEPGLREERQVLDQGQRPHVGRVAQRFHRVEASAFSCAGALSITITVPPGAQTRRISPSTAPGSSRWWNAKRETTSVNAPSVKGSGSTSPCRHVRFVRRVSDWRARARSSIAGVRSMPVTWRVTFAKAQARMPGPHATSSTVSPGPQPLNAMTVS